MAWKREGRKIKGEFRVFKLSPFTHVLALLKKVVESDEFMTCSNLMDAMYATIKESPLYEWGALKEIEKGEGSVEELLDYSEISFYDNLKRLFKEFKEEGIEEFDITYRFYKISVHAEQEANYISYLFRKIESAVGIRLNFKFKKLKVRELDFDE